MGTGRLHSAILILLSLCLAGRSGSLAGWVFTGPWLHASAGDSVLLRCLFQDPEATGWTVTKVDWLRVPGAGKQKVGQNRGWAMGGRLRQPRCSWSTAGGELPSCVPHAVAFSAASWGFPGVQVQEGASWAL